MAKKQSNTSLNQTRTFIKGLTRDTDASFIQDGMWNYARNAVNNTRQGDIGTLSNEESNVLCGLIGSDITVPNNVTIVGAIPLFESKWIIYSAIYNGPNNNVITSEIGLFEEEFCRYRPIVRDACLKFDKFYLISGASREKTDCSWQVYWADGNNPDRYLNIGDPKLWPSLDYLWLGGLDGSLTVNYYSNGTDTEFLWPGVVWNEDTENPLTPDPCETFPNLNTLDCEETRLSSLVKTPCIDINVGNQQGLLLNGSYAVGLSYTINEKSVTNYFSLSYIQPIYNEVDGKGSLEITLKDLDTEHFDEYEICIVYIVGSIPNYKLLGVYNIDTTKIVIDQVPDTLIDTSPTQIFKSNPVIDTSLQLTEANRYLLKIGPKSKFDFNYQPLANLIKSQWVSVEYPERYYINGGKNPSYLRDEVYSFFIRWVYNTGDKSASYHIPGRPPVQYSNGVMEDGLFNDPNNTFSGEELLFETINTAGYNSQVPNIDLDDGGKVIAYGDMGYWQSSEIYPSDKPEVWNSSAHCWTNVGSDTTYDLCGKYLRHHKFPDNNLNGNVNHFVKKSNGKFFIRLMGVRFKDIVLPKDNDGNDIKGIAGYEILRGSRSGNKSIVAKGMVNNFRDYTLQGTSDGNNTNKIGLYANYPFNTIKPSFNTGNAGQHNSGFNDPFILSRDGEEPIFGGGDEPPFNSQSVPKDMLSFHSPDTTFKTPYLQMSELKLYGSLRGKSEQQFITPTDQEHPEFQLLSDAVIVIAIFGGIISAILKQTGNIKINYPAGTFEPQYGPDIKQNAYQMVAGVLPATSGTNASVPQLQTDADGIFLNEDDSDDIAADNSPTEVLDDIETFNAFSQVFLGQASIDEIMTGINQEIFENGKYLTTPTITKDYTSKDLLPGIAGQFGTFSELLFDIYEGMNSTIELIKAIAVFRQYALEQVGYGEYDEFNNTTPTTRRYSVEDGIYVFKNNQDFPEYQTTAGVQRSYRINNINRPNKAVVRVAKPNTTQEGPDYIMNGSQTFDQSLMTLSQTVNKFSNSSDPVSFTGEGKQKLFENPIASYYAGLKFRIKNQYGQLNSISQIIATPCEQKIDFNNLAETSTTAQGCPNPLVLSKIQESSVFFGGDTYINRFTEKNIMPFFTDWLYKQPRGSIYNYFLYPSVPTPKFWANSEPWDLQEFTSVDNLTDAFLGNSGGSGMLPTSYYRLDNTNYNPASNSTGSYPGLLTPNNSYFYLAACGIRDFFVESEVIVDFRTRGDFERQYHYDKYRYTDLRSLFSIDPDILKAGNFYDYDYSLSISKFYINQQFNLGSLQSRSYDPTVAQLCYTTSPNVINYSLPETEEFLTESWRTFLPLNKVTFKNNINSVKSYSKTGMFVTFEDASPLYYGGVDQREDYLGVKATIGDGLLFSSTPRNVTAADSKYEYGSSQDRLGVISSPVGLFYISQQQGKIFTFGDSLQEISNINMKWWFEEFLPYKLIEDFPDFPHIDNPVAGIGCSAGYDNGNSIIYFSKKDYILKPEYKGKVTYLQNDEFSVLISTDESGGNKITVKLGDERIFEDASWTISFDPKSKQWISFHDWHPNLYLSGRSKHFTTKQGGVWKHNAGCNNYCNFYGVQHPFEIGVPFPTGQSVTTVRSIEYLLECYKRESTFCVDQFHILDYNFDQAVIFNSEQVSGYLNLNIFPKNNIALAEEYPRINNTSIDILVSKEEQKYRFNQFWDITKNRGEFPNGAGYPPTGQLIPDTTRLLGNYEERQIWNTKANGYVQFLNESNLDYSKPQLQRKKLRHYNNFVKLIKKNPQDANMVFKILNTKNQNSAR